MRRVFPVGLVRWTVGRRFMPVVCRRTAVPITTWLAAVRWLARRVPARRATLARTVRAAVGRWHF
ncbi:hypothetical protein DBO90_09100 [Mycobacterium avium]|nr:hypothetical protein DBO90_09100 [Mycobacterium avium]